MPKGMVVADSGAPRFSRDGARALPGDRSAARPAPPDPERHEPRPDRASISGPRRTRISSRCSASVPMRSAREITARSFTCGQEVRPARDAGSAEREPRRGPRTRRRHVGPALPAGSRPGTQTYSDVYVIDFKTGEPAAGPEALGIAADVVIARRQVPSVFRRDNRALVHLSRRRRRAREPHRAASSPVPAGRARYAGSAAGPYGIGGMDRRRRARCCSTTSSTSGRSSRTARSARNVTGGEGRKQRRSSFRYRSLDPEERTVPTEQAAAALGDQRARRARPASTGRRASAPTARAGESRDARQGVRRR